MRRECDHLDSTVPAKVKQSSGRVGGGDHPRLHKPKPTSPSTFSDTVQVFVRLFLLHLAESRFGDLMGQVDTRNGVSLFLQASMRESGAAIRGHDGGECFQCALCGRGSVQGNQHVPDRVDARYFAIVLGTREQEERLFKAPKELIRDAPKERATGPAASVRGHDHKVDLQLLSQLLDLGTHPSHADVRPDLDSCLPLRGLRRHSPRILSSSCLILFDPPADQLIVREGHG
jgi:hypothetical protein